MVKLNYGLNEFHNFTKNKKCYCFGAGLLGLHVIYLFENWKCTENIIAFIDNSDEKKGTNYEVENHLFPIVDIKTALKNWDKEAVIIITCADVMGVTEQLQQYDQLSRTVCFSLTEIAQNQLLLSDYDDVIKDSDIELIPKKIHYCWFGNEMPDFLKSNIKKWREICPDYEIIEWNENNYDVMSCVYMKESYEAKQWAFVPDYIRLDIIYKYGGIYLDTDIELLRSPDNLLYQNAFGISDGSFFLNLGAGFGAAPGNSILKELRDYYNSVHFKIGKDQYDRSACQIHQYRVLRKYNIKMNDKLQCVGTMNIYPMIMAATNTYSMQMRVCDKAYWAHYGMSAWMSETYKQNKRDMQKNNNDLINYTI